MPRLQSRGTAIRWEFSVPPELDAAAKAYCAKHGLTPAEFGRLAFAGKLRMKVPAMGKPGRRPKSPEVPQ